jgi:hypothetical protein
MLLHTQESPRTTGTNDVVAMIRGVGEVGARGVLVGGRTHTSAVLWRNNVFECDCDVATTVGRKQHMLTRANGRHPELNLRVCGSRAHDEQGVV